MNNRQLNANAVKQQLNRALSEIDLATLSSLRRARMQALDHYEAGRVTNPALAWINEHMHRHPSSHHHKPQLLIGAILIACLLGGFAYWQQTNDDTTDVDIEILTGDMPIHVFVD
jgi:reverse gyrase